MANERSRDSGREAIWRRVIQGQRGSGWTIREFCRRSKVPESAFYFWRRELERRDSARRQAKPKQRKRRVCFSTPAVHGATPAFVPVHLAVSHAELGADEIAPSGDGRIEIVLTAGRWVRVTPPVDRTALADVLAVLDGLPSVASAKEERPC